MRVTVSTALLRELAVLASADPRTVRRVLSGQRVVGMVDERIRRVLLARGLLPSSSTPTTGEVDMRLEARG